MITPRDMSRPECGFWLVKRGRNTPQVPARIFWCDHEPNEPTNILDRWPIPFLAAEIAGKPVDLDEVWHRKGTPITEKEYLFLMAERAWLQKYQPNDPLANPDKPVRIADIPLPDWSRP
jgi:hypothetical protein